MYKNLAEIKLFFMMASSSGVWFYIEIHLRSTKNPVSATLKPLEKTFHPFDKPGAKTEQ